MKALFTQTVKIEKHHFARGVHEIPQELLEHGPEGKPHPHLDLYVKAGWIVEPKEKEEQKLESIDERNQRIAKELQDREAKAKAFEKSQGFDLKKGSEEDLKKGSEEEKKTKHKGK